jgi:hypothetical protein
MARIFARALWVLAVLFLAIGGTTLAPGLAHGPATSHLTSIFAIPFQGTESQSTPSPLSTPPPLTPPAELVAYQPALLPQFAADLAIRANAPRYDIVLFLEEGEKPVLRGIQHVRYTNEEAVPLDYLVFRLYPNLPAFGGTMEVGTITVGVTPVEPVYAANRSAIYVPLRPALMPGQKVDVALEFRTILPTDTRSGYAVFTYADEVYALAGFYPTIPVYDAQGWDV